MAKVKKLMDEKPATVSGDKRKRGIKEDYNKAMTSAEPFAGDSEDDLSDNDSGSKSPSITTNGQPASDPTQTKRSKSSSRIRACLNAPP